MDNSNSEALRRNTTTSWNVEKEMKRTEEVENSGLTTKEEEEGKEGIIPETRSTVAYELKFQQRVVALPFLHQTPNSTIDETG
jgi:hypothetical protein